MPWPFQVPAPPGRVFLFDGAKKGPAHPKMSGAVYREACFASCDTASNQAGGVLPPEPDRIPRLVETSITPHAGQKNCKAAISADITKSVILSERRILLVRRPCAAEILRCAQNDVPADFAIPLHAGAVEMTSSGQNASNPVPSLA